MFARIRVPGSPPYEALLVPDAAIGTEQVRKFVLRGRRRQHRAAEIRHARSARSTDLRVIKDGLAADDRVIVNGLMRVRPGQKVNAAGAGRGAAAGAAGRAGASRTEPAKRDRAPMRISHFFIDRPIFAAVVSIVIVILGAVSFLAPAGRAISRDRAAGHQRLRPVSRRQRRSRRLDRGGADRGADQRRREHALRVVELDGRRPLLDRVTFDLGTNLDIAQVQVQNRVAIAQPRLAGRRAQHRRHRDARPRPT